MTKMKTVICNRKYYQLKADPHLGHVMMSQLQSLNEDHNMLLKATKIYLVDL